MSATLPRGAVIAAAVPAQRRFGGPVDTPIGRSIATLVLYQVEEKDEAPVEASREDLHAWFRELGINEAFLPNDARAVDAFRQATADMSESFEADGASYTLTVKEDRIGRSQSSVTRNVMMTWSEQGRFKEKRVGHLQFTRAKIVGTARSKGTERFEWFVDTRLTGLVHARVSGFLERCAARYEAHRRSIEPHGFRMMLRAYFQQLNGVALLGARSTFVVPLPYDDPALTGMAEVMDRADLWMALVPLADLPGMRRLVFRSVDLDIQRRVRLLVNEIQRICELNPAAPPSPMRRAGWITTYRELLDLLMGYTQMTDLAFPGAAAACERLRDVIAGLPAPTRPTHERVIKRWGGTWSDDQAVTL